MVTKIFQVNQIVEVTVDETKFTEDWMASFRKFFYKYKTVDDHMGHIAQLEARGVYSIGAVGNVFIEGYGPADEMGIKATVQDCEIDPYP